MRGIRTQAALAARRYKLGSVDVVFSLGEGNCCDPLQTVVLQHWRTLYKLLFAQTMPAQYLRLWQITWEKLLKAPKRWALVKGPVAAMIAYLQDLGVKAQDPSSWQCPTNSLQGPGLWSFPGDVITLAPGQTTRIHAEEGLRHLLQFWTNHRISQQDAGSGAERGVDWSVPRRLLKSQLRRPNHLTALRSVWQGAFFTTTKGAKRTCPLCKKPANIRHVLLECRWWSGRGPAPPPHWKKLQAAWPAESFWVRALPPASYTACPEWPSGAFQPVFAGAWRNKHRIDATDLVFGTDATGTTNDPRTRVVAAAVVACTLEGGVLTEIGRITQVLPAGCNVVQGEAWALALPLRHTFGNAAVTADCKPAIAQAECATYRASHTNIWDDVWEERHRLQITWHPSHRTAEEYQQRYGDPRHWRVRLNDLADEVAQIDELTEEISHFLAHRTWVLLAGDEAPPLDCKPRNLPSKCWLKKPAQKEPGPPPCPRRRPQQEAEAREPACHRAPPRAPLCLDAH